MSNLEFRQGNRSPFKFASDLFGGTSAQNSKAIEWIKNHRKFYHDTDFPIHILKWNIKNDGSKVIKTHYADSLDLEILFKCKDSYFVGLYEVEMVNKESGNFARFKRHKIIKNIEKKIPIIHFQNTINTKMIVISVEDQMNIELNNLYETSTMYEGKPYHLVDVSKTNYLSVETLQPEHAYLDFWRTLVKHVKKVM